MMATYEADLPRRTHSPAMVASEIHGEPAHNNGHRTVRPGGDHEKRAIFHMFAVMDAHENREACNGDEDVDDREKESVPETIRHGGSEHAPAKGGSPRRDGMKLRLNSAVSV